MSGAAENPRTGSGIVVRGFWLLVSASQLLVDALGLPCHAERLEIAAVIMLTHLIS